MNVCIRIFLCTHTYVGHRFAIRWHRPQCRQLEECRQLAARLSSVLVDSASVDLVVALAAEVVAAVVSPDGICEVCSVAVCCGVLRELQCIATIMPHEQKKNVGICKVFGVVCCGVLWCVAVCCGVLQCVAAVVLPDGICEVCSVAVCCDVLQCVAVSCSVLRLSCRPVISVMRLTLTHSGWRERLHDVRI